MTDRSSTGPPQPSPDAVRRSLRALADGSAPGCCHAPAEAESADAASPRPSASTDTVSPPPPVSPNAVSSPPPKPIVHEAERAAEDARAAAAFLSAERLPHIDAAITAAAARGDDELAERGRAARTSLRRLDAALER